MLSAISMILGMVSFLANGIIFGVEAFGDIRGAHRNDWLRIGRHRRMVVSRLK